MKKQSVYDVIGYHYYSPLSKIGRARWKSETAKIIRKISKHLGKRVYDLGCGGGIWSFYLEKLGKQVTGIDINKTMIIIAKEYKKLHSKKSKFVQADILSFDYKKHDSAILLDNTIAHLSKTQFEKLLKKLKDKIKVFVIEIYKNEIKEGVLNYRFGNFDIKETVKRINNNLFKREFINKQTGAKIKIKSYRWNVKTLENILKKFFRKIETYETKNSILFACFN